MGRVRVASTHCRTILKIQLISTLKSARARALRGTVSAHPLLLFSVLQAPLAHFLPHMVGFKLVTRSYPHVGTPKGSAQAITAVR